MERLEYFATRVRAGDLEEMNVNVGGKSKVCGQIRRIEHTKRLLLFRAYSRVL